MSVTARISAVPRETVISLALLASVLALAYGIWYAYSVMLVALLNDFGWSRSVLAGAFSVFAVVQGSMNPLLGALCDRVRPAVIMAVGSVGLGAAMYANSLVNEPWQFYLTFGGFTAVTVAMCGWIPAVVTVQRRFPHRLGFALGIVSSGIGVGMLLVTPLCQLLIDAWGWRSAFRVVGVLCVIVILPSALYLRGRATPARASVATTSGTASAADMTLRQAARTLPFWLMVVIFFCGTACSQTLHVHQVAFLVDHGIGALFAAGIVGIVGVASVVGKTGGGWLSDRMEREVVFGAGVAIMVGSVGALWLAGSTGSEWLATVYAVMLGIGYSATAALVPAMVSDRFRGRHFGSILGIGLLGSASGSAFGPWFAGYLFDHTGSYGLAFEFAAALGVCAVIAGVAARRLRRRAPA